MPERLGYIRIPDTASPHYALQHDALHAVGCDRIWTDVTIPTIIGRPERDKLLDTLQPGDTVVVWQLDRLARGANDLITVTSKIVAAQGQLISLREGIDTTHPTTGGAMRTLILAYAECQHDLRAERSTVGLGRARGRSGGRPPSMTKPMLAQARTMKSDGATMGQIAKALGVSRATIYRHFN
jgi:DNA invertase Pin-like site-specific DNA recombinase